MAKEKKISIPLAMGFTQAKKGDLKLNLSRGLSSDVMISITEVADITTEQQRVTARMWSNQWAKHEGSTDGDRCYNWFKYKYLWPKIAANHPDIESKLEALKSEFPNITKTELGIEIIADKLSYKDASVQEFHDALNDYQVWLISDRGVQITNPDKHHQIRKQAIETGKMVSVNG